jgi:uracil-DNA glycosylase family 4
VTSRRGEYLDALGLRAYVPRVPLPLGSPPPRPVAADSQGLDWDELELAVRDCRRCALCGTRTQTVFGVGARDARLLVVGEAPGAEEDRQGEPFVGRAGQLLNSVLRAAGFGREQVFIANILKCRPPDNRDPLPAEVEQCLPYLERQIELVRPALLLCVGRIAAQNLLRTDVTIGRLRGRVHRLASGLPVVVTYHPAYLLRSPGEKRKVWDDLKLAMGVLRDGHGA